MNQDQQPASAAQSGKAYRMGRIFGPDHKTVVLPLDHGTMMGRVPGLEDPVKALASFMSYSCDGFLIGPGVAARSAALFATRGAPARLLTIDSYWNAGGTGVTAMISELHTAAALGVDAVKILMPWNVPAASTCGHGQHGVIGRGRGRPVRYPGHGRAHRLRDGAGPRGNQD